jgi:F-type H+-transporting ATPase subunit a
MASLHISITAETLFYVGPIPVSNSMLTSWVVTLFLVGLSLWAKNHIKKTKKPTGLQNFLEMMVESLHNITANITQSTARTNIIFPFFLSFFLFILLNNWLGLFPGVGTIGLNLPAGEDAGNSQSRPSPFVKQVSATTEPSIVVESPDEPKYTFVPLFRAGTADLNTTLGLALISVIATQIIGIKFLGLSYFEKFINVKGPISFFVGILETISEISKVISFTFRLFGNIFAGEVLLAVMAFLVPLIVPMPFIALEVFVGVIQAFVFSVLTLVFMNMATQGHDSEKHA